MNEVTAADRVLTARRTGTRRIHSNLPVPVLVEHALARGEGVLSPHGALIVHTGQHTGRSAQDKFVTEDAVTRGTINWGKINVPIPESSFRGLRERLTAHLESVDVHVQDVFAGADHAHRINVRVISEQACAALFARTMFIRPSRSQLDGFAPDFTIYHAPSLHADPTRDKTRTGTFIILNLKEREILIGGTSYAGEIKKSIFTVLNYLLPQKGVMPMHCSANVGERGDVALFFGLSGTGKTTLSADPNRALLGDDEHGWSDDGIFNFEGGCYAKTIRLSPTAEPEIYDAVHRFGAYLENVVYDPDSRQLDLNDASLTENTRGSYPVTFLRNIIADGCAGHPVNMVMLTADAFGVLPPVARLTPEQAVYYFISGYTAKVAGTEKGLGKEPQATFSPCFGGPFMPLHPRVYAELLRERIKRHKTAAWLVNTGWTGGPYGTGQRMEIVYSRAIITAIVSGELDRIPRHPDPIFGLAIPDSCPGIPSVYLNPRNTWPDQAKYDARAREVAGLFRANIAQYAADLTPETLTAGPA